MSDNAHRDKVKEMVSNLLDHDGLEGDVRREAEDVWTKYKNSWPDWGGDKRVPTRGGR